jgi:hypothetical protein
LAGALASISDIVMCVGVGVCESERPGV